MLLGTTECALWRYDNAFLFTNQSEVDFGIAYVCSIPRKFFEVTKESSCMKVLGIAVVEQVTVGISGGCHNVS
jgi:hypothetical protein